MNLILKLSWRNLWRNKRRTLFTFLAVAFAVLIPELMKGFQIGTFNFNIENTLRDYSGYIQIERKEYFATSSPAKSFGFSEHLQNVLQKTPGVVAFAPRVSASGLIAFGKNVSGVMLTGVNPKQELKTSRLTKKIVTGNFLDSDSSANIILGEKLFEDLNLRLGEKVVVLAQGADGTMGNLKFKVAGVIRFGSPRLDNQIAFVGLKTAQELLALDGKLNVVTIRLNSLNDCNPVALKLKSEIKNPKLTVLTWKEFMPGLEQTVKMKAASVFLIEIILFLIVAFGVLNTMLMAVAERYLEFGISLSIGISNLKLSVTIFFEMLLTIILGIILGNIFGYALNYYFAHHPIVVGGAMKKMYAHYGFLPFIYSSVEPQIFINVTLTIIVISTLVSLYPIYKVFELEPLKGIRYT